MNVNPEYQAESDVPFNPDNFTVPGDWMCLSQYGSFPHSNFLQDFSYNSAVKIVDDFKANQQLIPLYAGHPDDPQFSDKPDHQDKTPYAIITELEARERGLYFKALWNPNSIEHIKGKSLQFLSPRWVCNHNYSDDSQDIYEPAELISIGLTNDPNLPLDPLPKDFFENLSLSVNSKDHDSVQATDPIIDALASIAQLPKETHPSVILDFFVSLLNQTESFRETNQQLCQQLITLETESERTRKLFLATQEKLHSVEELLKQEKASRLNPGIPTASKTANLRPFEASENAKDRFIDCVNEHMKQTGQSFANSWKTVKQKFPHVFTAMQEDSLGQNF